MILSKATSNILSKSYSTSRGDCREKNAAGWAGPIVITNVIHDLLGSQIDYSKARNVYLGTVYNVPYTITLINQDRMHAHTVVHKRWFGATHDIDMTFKHNNTWSQTDSY